MKKATLKNILLKELKINKADHKEHLLICESLKEQEGKKVTKHFQKHLPNGYKLKNGFNGPEVESITGNNHFLAYKGEESEEFRIKNFEERNAPYNRGARERAEKLSNILNSDEQFNKWFEHYKKAEKAIKLLKELDLVESKSFDNPAHYVITNKLIETNLKGVYSETVKEIERVIR